MGVYINGMKMPKGCATCPYCDRTWNKPKCKAKSIQGRFMEQRLNLDRTRQKWCPLVHVLPHGDLIDANKLGELCDIMADKCDGIGVSIWHQFKTTVEWSPIVIPAEGHMDTDSWGEEYAEAKGLAEEGE